MLLSCALPKAVSTMTDVPWRRAFVNNLKAHTAKRTGEGDSEDEKIKKGHKHEHSKDINDGSAAIHTPRPTLVIVLRDKYANFRKKRRPTASTAKPRPARNTLSLE